MNITRLFRQLLSGLITLAVSLGIGVSIAPQAAAAGNGSFATPYEVGQTFEAGDWLIKAGPTDSDAWAKIKKANKGNKAPRKGWQYAMVPLTVTFTGDHSRNPYWDLDWNILVNKMEFFADDCGVLPNDLGNVGYMDSWDTVTANVCVAIPAKYESWGFWQISGRAVMLYKNSRPSFTTHPTTKSVWVGNKVTLSAKANGAWQWQWQYKSGSRWINIKGATKKSYTFTATKAHNNRSYRVRANNWRGNSYSRMVKVTVWTNPRITSQPQSVTVSAGKTATLKGTVAGAKSLQWQYKSGKAWKSIKGATKATYQVKATPKLNGRQYRLVAKNTYGTTISKTVKLTVKAPKP